MASVMGLDAKIYYDESGVGGSSWTELTNVKDVTLNLDRTEVDVTTRANDGWKASETPLKEASVEFQMIYDTSDAGFTAMMDAYLNNTLIGIAACDGNVATSGTQGLHADMKVMNIGQQQELENVIMVSVTLKPTYSGTAPDWVTTV